MSGVSAGRLLMFTWRVMLPASSFETPMLVMSGAAASSPTESVNVWELATTCDDPPTAAGTPTRSIARASRIVSLDLIGASLPRPWPGGERSSSDRVRFGRDVSPPAYARDDPGGARPRAAAALRERPLAAAQHRISRDHPARDTGPIEVGHHHPVGGRGGDAR